MKKNSVKKLNKIVKFLWDILPTIILMLTSISILTILPLRNSPFKAFIVTSGSMQPRIPEGSIVFVQRKPVNPLKTNDIITFKKPDNPVHNITHRIVKIIIKNKKTVIITKGDANNSNDIWDLKKEAIWGKVVFSLPYIGYFANFAKTKVGVIILVLIPLGLILISEIVVIFREIKKLRKKSVKKNSSNIFTKIVILLLIFLNTTLLSAFGIFTDKITTTLAVVNSKCWTNPNSTSLLLPTDNTITDSTDLDFSWSATTSSCPIANLEYNFQIFNDPGLTTLITESGFLSNLSYIFSTVPEGEYWWRVQAQDQYNNISNSNIYHLTIDHSTPLIPSMSVTGSFTKAVEEKISNGDFETGDLTGWSIAGNVAVGTTDSITDPSIIVNPYEGNYMLRIGSPYDPGNYVWENRLMKSFDSGAKSISMHYNFFSRETAGSDTPGFFIRINGQEIFKQNSLSSDGSTALSTDWTEFYYDLSNHTDAKINLALYAGNTGDTLSQSWVYLDKITTYFVSAPAHAVYNLSGSDNIGGSGINHFEYNIDDTGWVIGSLFGNSPPLSLGGEHTVQYMSVDNAGNQSAVSTVKIITDVSAPNAITDLTISSINENTATLTWTAPGNDDISGRASTYDIRYSTTNIDDTNFISTTKIEKISSPKTAGETEAVEIIGLNQATTYYFAIKSSDEAPNISALSNIPTATTNIGITVNTGDIVVNELMWMGSSISDADEWIELRNMTDHLIDLSTFKLTKLASGSETDMAISFTGKSIAAHGYFLVANSNSYAGGDSQIKDTITPDIWDSSLDLSNSTLKIGLYWNDGITDNLIDMAWDGTILTEGIYDLTPGLEKYYSMERTSIPGDGTNPLNWYSCIDEASKTDFFENSADERGTPRAENRSENEPYIFFEPTLTPTPTTEPTITIPTISPTPELLLSPTEPVPTISSTPGVEETVTPTQTPIEPTVELQPELTQTP